MNRTNVGDKRQITIGDTLYDAVVVSISETKSEEMSGTLETYDIEGYGVTQPYYVPDSIVTGARTDARRNLSMIPPEYVYKLANDFKWSGYRENVSMQKKIVNAFVINFAECKKQGRGLYIFSETKGSGKTMLACCVANEIMKRQDISVKFITTLDYLELCKKKTDDAQEMIRTIQDCSFLILDDIGTESEKDWVNDMLYRLINHRDSALLPTIYTSNKEIAKLKLDSRIINRIEGHSIPVCMPEQSIRQERAQKSTEIFLKHILLNTQENIFGLEK